MGSASADEDIQTATARGAPPEGMPTEPTTEAALEAAPAGAAGVSATSVTFTDVQQELAAGRFSQDQLGQGQLGHGSLLGDLTGRDFGAAEPAPLSTGPTPSAAIARPSFVFFGVVAGLALAADILSKVWAEMTLNQRGFEPLDLIKDHLSITLAYNRGGAWGLFAGASDMIRKPFFLSVSVAAIAFIISLYARLTTRQKALKWGLPLVLGGALGNLNDRITRSQVIDFIDFRADWIMDLNVLVHRYVASWAMTDHWPTFNIADVAICVGVGLMAVDMFSHRPRRTSASISDGTPSSGPSSSGPATPSEAPPAMG